MPLSRLDFSDTLSGSASSVSTTVNSCAVGDLLVIACRWYGTQTVSSITVTGESNPTPLDSPHTGGVDNGRVQWAVCPITAAGNKTITFTPSASPSALGVCAWRISGHDASPVDGATVGNSGTGDTLSVSKTTGVDGAGLFAVSITSGGGDVTFDAAYTAETLGNYWYDSGAYDLDAGTAGSKSVGGTSPASGTWVLSAISIKPDAGGPPPDVAAPAVGDAIGSAGVAQAPYQVTYSTAGGGPITVAINPATETDTAQPIGRRKVRALGTATETDAAQSFGRQKLRALGFLFGTETAQPIGRVKIRAIGVATETDAAQAITVGAGGPIVGSVGTALESDVAQIIGRAKLRALAVAGEADAAIALARIKVRATGAAATSEGAQAITPRKMRAVLFAASVEAAQPVGRMKRRTLGTVVESSAALAITATGGTPPPASDPSAALRSIRVRRRP